MQNFDLVYLKLQLLFILYNPPKRPFQRQITVYKLTHFELYNLNYDNTKIVHALIS